MAKKLIKLESITLAEQDPVEQNTFRFEGLVPVADANSTAARNVWKMGANYYKPTNVVRTGRPENGLCPVLVTASKAS